MSNLKFKGLFIAAVILVCLYGIIGIPTSMADITKNWEKNIKLGLDLKGGSQLVIQMQLQDAFKAEADSVIQRMRDELAKANVQYTEISRNDPQRLQDAETIQIDVKGIPATRAG